MRLLVDTSVFLLLATDPTRVPATYRKAMDGAETRHFSIASVWEIAIKASLGKMTLPQNAGDYVRARMESFQTTLLDIRFEHAARVESLKLLHRDPFDRLLIAQAMVEGLTILTTDRKFSAYNVRVFGRPE